MRIEKWDSSNKKKEIEVIKNKKFYVFGAGILGSELKILLDKYSCFEGFVDNDTRKQHCGYLEASVLSLNEYINLSFDTFLIVAVSQKNQKDVIELLKNSNLKEGRDFCMYEDFRNYYFPIISIYKYNKSFMAIAQITLTERCTLKCKKCAHGCYAVSNNAADMPLEDVYKSADSFFAKVDYIHEFVLIGGEPLLYEDLSKAIEYIGQKYRNQIGIYSITTNGTIIPKQEILNVCGRYNVIFRISNYTNSMPRLKVSHEKLIERLQNDKIAYYLGKAEKEWIDYGFEYINRKATEEDLIRVFDICKTPCREVRGNRLYFCVMARSISDNLGFHLGRDDYLDLDALPEDSYKEELLAFQLGYSKKGYLDMCNHCRGADARNYPIPAAEQTCGLGSIH